MSACRPIVNSITGSAMGKSQKWEMAWIAPRHSMILTRLFTYILEGQKGSNQYKTLADAWTGIVSTNAIHELLQSSQGLEKWMYSKNSNGKVRMIEFQLERCVGRLRPSTIYSDTIRIIKEMLKEEGMETLFRRCTATFIFSRARQCGKEIYLRNFNTPGFKKYLRSYESELVPLYQNYRFSREINDINPFSKSRLIQKDENKHILATSLVSDVYREELQLLSVPFLPGESIFPPIWDMKAKESPEPAFAGSGDS